MQHQCLWKLQILCVTWDTETGWKCRYYFVWETAPLWKLQGELLGTLGCWCCLFWCHTHIQKQKKDGWDSSDAACVVKPWGAFRERLRRWSGHGQQARNASRKQPALLASGSFSRPASLKNTPLTDGFWTPCSMQRVGVTQLLPSNSSKWYFHFTHQEANTNANTLKLWQSKEQCLGTAGQEFNSLSISLKQFLVHKLSKNIITQVFRMTKREKSGISAVFPKSCHKARGKPDQVFVAQFVVN